MPLTPLHLGPALLLGLVFFTYLDFPTFLVANIVIDVEPILVLLFHLDYPLHGFLHSFLGGTLSAVFLALIMSRVRDHFSYFLAIFQLSQTPSFKRVFLASITGIYRHILLDARVHFDVRPFYPLDLNPLLSRSALPGLEVTLFCLWSFVGGVILYGLKLFLGWRKVNEQ